VATRKKVMGRNLGALLGGARPRTPEPAETVAADVETAAPSGEASAARGVAQQPSSASEAIESVAPTRQLPAASSF